MSNDDLVVLGVGATGLAAARAARNAGRSVAIIDKADPGGDCTHFGCVPSKTLLDVRGWARLTGPTTLDIEGRTLHGSRLVLATGASAALPPIEGLAETDHLDNRRLFSLTQQPEHLLVMGGGAIGVELAQAFAQLGSLVTLVEGTDRILTKEEPEASAVMTTGGERAGVDVRTGSAVQKVSRGPTLHLADGSSWRGTTCSTG